MKFGEDRRGRSLRAPNGETILHSCTLELNHHVAQTDSLEDPARLGDCHGLLGIHHQQVAAAEVDAEVLLAANCENDD